jgi:hypothetical protein
MICGKSLKKDDHIDYKIIAFDVKKRAFPTPCKIGIENFNSSWLQTFAPHKVEAFDISLGD